MTLLGVGSFLRIRSEITRGISGGGQKKPSGGGIAKRMLSRNMRTMHASFFARFWRRFACSVGALLTKICVSELRRKLIKSALLVGRSRGCQKSSVFFLGGGRQVGRPRVLPLRNAPYVDRMEAKRASQMKLKCGKFMGCRLW